MIDKVFFDITQYCNGNCKYCFTNSLQFKKESDCELKTSEIINLLDDLVSLGIKKVSIGGGEPFLKNLEEIIKKSNKKIKFSITSNGLILSEEFFKQFKANENIKLTISLDSLSNEKSNLIRNNIDINKVVDNIKKLCKEKEVRERLSIRTTISKINYKDVHQIIDFCEKYKIRNLKVNSTNEFGRAKENQNIILPFKQFMTLLEELVEYCNNVKEVNVELPVEKYLKGIDRKCLCGVTSLYINWDGEVYPCAFTEGKLKLGNIKERPIKEIIANEVLKFNHDNDFCCHCPINRYKEYERKTKELIS